MVIFKSIFMKIQKVIIKNFKIFKEFEIDFNEDLNIFVGDNETGKSIILEAINLVLTGKLSNSFLLNDISPYLFNKEIADEYIKKIKNDNKPRPPEILIEVYFYDTEINADFNLSGGEHSLVEGDYIGICLEIKLNDEFRDIYSDYIKENKEIIKTIPTEYYTVSRRDFSASKKNITVYEKKYQPIFVDTTTINIQNDNDYFVQNMIHRTLDIGEQKKLSIEYKHLKEAFSSKPDIKKINNALTKNCDITDSGSMNISLDISSRNNWLRNLVSYVDDIPLFFIGKGKQNKIKINLALNKGEEISDIVLIDEPENHLSFPRLNSLINNIRDKSENKQLIITTHSHFITNKLGLSKLIILNHKQKKPLYLHEDLPQDTQKYFQKLSDYDTLRLALSRKAILVEGPSDSLIVQKIYQQTYDNLPIEDFNPIDIITVNGLSFKRFLDIAKHLNSKIAVITDNDGRNNNRIDNLIEYKSDSIKIFTDADAINSMTLEPSLINAGNNELLIKQILGKENLSKDELVEYMSGANKTDVALKIFESEIKIAVPSYINSAIEYVKN